MALQLLLFELELGVAAGEAMIRLLLLLLLLFALLVSVDIAAAIFRHGGP